MPHATERTFRDRWQTGARIAGLAAALVTASFTLGCTTQPTSGPDEFSTSRPVKLAPPSGESAETRITLAAVDETELRKAIERYRIKLEREESPVKTAGVDLTGDGQPEALVLFTGADWCVTTGCSFIVFRESETGYEAVSRTTRVRGPVKVGPGSNAGWRDLIVKTGGGAAPIRFVRLGFSGNGYPRNALLQPAPTEDVLAQATDVIPEVPFQASKPQASSAR
ncbi:hypothetical protein [Dichotomicrobium thermohalophilum]|uniref:Lipoprotein n=1 Tax=Dichotomicrobium thermohalophilum TaxID=933063 RepID=A0A397Q678_9HYPH|nr:hypothetical protein [Dichotomicrobium thermohalophilum]RIA55315.1 hypothetical protein BXY53_0376 [Dichotomicrobium thermohalophilum]